MITFLTFGKKNKRSPLEKGDRQTQKTTGITCQLR